MAAYVAQLAARGWPQAFDLVQHKPFSGVFGQRVEALGVAAHRPGGDAGDLFWRLRAPMRRHHAGGAVREHAWAVAVLLPERFAGEVELGHRLRGQHGHRFGLRPGERRVDVDAPQRGNRRRAQHVRRLPDVAVGAMHPRFVASAFDGRHRRAEPHVALQRPGHRFGDALHAVAGRPADDARRRVAALGDGERGTGEQHQRGDVRGIAAVAGVHVVAERDGGAQSARLHPVAHGDVERSVFGTKPVLRFGQWAVARGERARIGPGQDAPVFFRERIGGMRRPFVLADELAAQGQFLLSEERQHGRGVDQRHAEALCRADHQIVASADRRAASLLHAVAAIQRAHAPADLRLRFHHRHPRARFFETQRGGEAGEAGTDDHDVCTGTHPHDAGRAFGRPGGQQSVAHTSAHGPRLPRAGRCGWAAMRSRTKSRTMFT